MWEFSGSQGRRRFTRVDRSLQSDNPSEISQIGRLNSDLRLSSPWLPVKPARLLFSSSSSSSVCTSGRIPVPVQSPSFSFPFRLPSCAQRRFSFSRETSKIFHEVIGAISRLFLRRASATYYVMYNAFFFSSTSRVIGRHVKSDRRRLSKLI